MIDGAPENAAVLVYDPVQVNQRLTRRCLTAVGFTRIYMTSSAEELARAIATEAFDLIVGEIGEDEDPLCPLIKRIRAGEIGENPFVVALLTSWVRDDTRVKRALDCGADDVLLRPYSINALRDRVRTLVRARKGFIITSDYIGPCRRRDERQLSDTTALIHPPNTLRIACIDGLEALQSAERNIADAQKALGAERVRRLAMRLMASADLNEGELDAKARRSLDQDRNRLPLYARELQSRLAQSGRVEAAEIGKALVRAAERAAAARKAEPRTLALVKDLALASYRAYAGELAASSVSGELADVLGAVRAKLARAS